MRFWLAICVLLGPVAGEANARDYARAEIAASKGGQVAAGMLAQRRAERTGLPQTSAGDSENLIVLAEPGQVKRLLPLVLRGAWARIRQADTGEEGFAVHTLDRGGRHALVLTGRSERALVYAAGWLLRQMETRPGHAELDPPSALVSMPDKPVRGTQIGYRFKNNSYDAWTLDMFDRRIADFAIFGGNAVQVIAPASDDAADSPLFPAPPLQTIAGIGRIARKYGLDFDLYYPVLRDYRNPGAVEAELADFENLVKSLPPIHALYVPGGDPGHTHPDLLFLLVEKQAAILRRHHPGASLWISTQGFDARELDAFYAQLDRQPQWLTGIFVGPQTRDPVPLQRARIPARYALQLYPDIAHTLHAQFPVPEWDARFALSEGREPVNPRPAAYTGIYRHFAPYHDGFITYSEGVNDDFNQMLWFQLGWSATADPQAVAGEYARHFIGDPAFADGLFALERNWQGPPQDNAGIDATLSAFDAMRPQPFSDWRFDAALYRAVYDAWIRARAIAEGDREKRALAALADAGRLGSANAISRARAVLAEPDAPQPLLLRARLFALADRLYAQARLQLSVGKYGASAIERGANLDRVDVSLNDRVWMEKRMAAIAALSSEAERVEALVALADHRRARYGALYDDLGNPAAEPHLVRGKGFAGDPQLYESAIDGIADMMPDDGWRMSELTYAETLYDRPIEMAYDGLDPAAGYCLIATYAGEDYQLPMRLVANGTFELHPPMSRTTNPMTVRIAIPRKATKEGRLHLAWTRPPGVGGGGRGHQIAETWLIPASAAKSNPCSDGASR